MNTGILVLNQNKTYGKTKNGKKLLYKCISTNNDLGEIVLPYELKLGFSKSIKNKFVAFSLVNKEENTINQGVLEEVFGDVDDLNAYYEYQLVNKGLKQSSTVFQGKIRELSFTILEMPKETPRIFSIDGETTTDFDDAFSVDIKNQKLVIYISNVAYWIEKYGLWSCLTSAKPATIYLPNKKQTLLPPLLSKICALKEGEVKHVVSLHISFDKGVPLKTEWKQEIVRIGRNYVYETAELFESAEYRDLLALTQSQTEEQMDSHLVVAYWMEYYNRNCARDLAKKETGIFYQLPLLNECGKGQQPYTVDKIIKQWLEGGGSIKNKYYLFDRENVGENLYLHATSPIRRLPDIYNQFLLFHWEQDVIKSMNKVPPIELNELNQQIRKIKKLQMETTVLDRVCNDIEIMNKIWNGIIVSQEDSKDGLFNYTVYLQDLKLFSIIKSNICLRVGENHGVRLFLFEKEHSIKRKIRLEIQHKDTEL